MALTGWIVGVLAVLVAPVVHAEGSNAREAAAQRFVSLASKAGQAAPLIRIGLESAHRIEIQASRPYRILDPRTGESVWKAGFDGTIQAVAHGGPTGEVALVYRVQVAAFSTRAAARKELNRLLGLVDGEGIVHRDADEATGACVWGARAAARGCLG